MIKQALQYIVGLGKANIEDIQLRNGNIETFSDKELYRIDPYIPRANAIEMHTLTSLVDYIKSKTDTMALHMIIDVKSPEEVWMYSCLNDDDRKRECMVKVHARITDFDFNTFMDQEKFCINIQSKFLDDPNTERALILKFAGTVETGTVAEYGDDGVTQKATVKTGIASKGEAIVPNPVKLRPYRTFLEVEQPASDFIFRMKQDKYDGVQCAIFEADGGAWKIAATKAIKDFLMFELEGLESEIQYTIIS